MEMDKRGFTTKRAERGFTLIELLVVIAIIALLSTVVLASLNNARDRARDARRASDVQNLRTALELLRHDNRGNPYDAGGNVLCIGENTGASCWGGDGSGSTAFATELAKYLKSLPKDPTPNRFYGHYTYKAPGNYWLGSTVAGGTGSYAIMWVPEEGATEESCKATGGTFGKWVGDCPSGGSCRQCGLVVK